MTITKKKQNTIPIISIKMQEKFPKNIWTIDSHKNKTKTPKV